jgi:hypothetical protein
MSARATYARLNSATVASTVPSAAKMVERSAKGGISMDPFPPRNCRSNRVMADPRPATAGNSPAATRPAASATTSGRDTRRPTVRAPLSWACPIVRLVNVAERSMVWFVGTTG